MLRDDLKSFCASGASRKVHSIPAPELVGFEIFVRELRGDDLKFVSASETGLDDRDRWAIRSLCDEAGNRIFCDDDLAWMAGDCGLPTPLKERAYYAARYITGYTEENRLSFLKASGAMTGPGSPSS